LPVGAPLGADADADADADAAAAAGLLTLPVKLSHLRSSSTVSQRRILVLFDFDAFDGSTP